jgi:hypothetical protein
MAELYIFDWTYKHWMDDLTPEEVAQRIADNPDFERKYNARWQAGDIKEIYPDGHLPTGETISPDTKEVVLKIPSLSFSTAIAYRDAHIDSSTSTEPRLLLRRKYKVNWNNVPVAIKNQLSVTRVITLTKVADAKIVAKV